MNLRESIDKWRGSLTQARLTKLVEHPNLVNLVRTARDLGLFRTLPGNGNEYALKSDELYCFKGDDVVVNETLAMKTVYLVYNNTCIILQHRDDDTIIKIRIKKPTGTWRFEKTSTETVSLLSQNGEYLDIYSWYWVDWLGFGRKDIGSNYVSGTWNESTYYDVQAMFDIVDSKTSTSVFKCLYKDLNRK